MHTLLYVIPSYPILSYIHSTTTVHIAFVFIEGSYITYSIYSTKPSLLLLLLLTGLTLNARSTDSLAIGDWLKAIIISCGCSATATTIATATANDVRSCFLSELSDDGSLLSQ